MVYIVLTVLQCLPAAIQRKKNKRPGDSNAEPAAPTVDPNAGRAVPKPYESAAQYVVADMRTTGKLTLR